MTKNQGKHPKPRSVVVFEGNPVLNIRHLVTDLIAWRRRQGAKDTDYLFAWKDNTWPTFRGALDTVLREASALIDPMSGERRVAYSFRHYFATVQIERGLSVAHLAQWMGTSSAMIEKHYNRFLMERQAHLVNEAPDKPLKSLDHIDEDGVPWHWDEDRREYAPGCRCSPVSLGRCWPRCKFCWSDTLTPAQVEFRDDHHKQPALRIVIRKAQRKRKSDRVTGTLTAILSPVLKDMRNLLARTQLTRGEQTAT